VSTQALCQGVIKRANACLNECLFLAPVSRMRRCQAVTGMGQIRSIATTRRRQRYADSGRSLPPSSC
jgi:hypothetical protein